MICLTIECNSPEEMFDTRNEMHRALQGSPGYINSEIAIIDNTDTSFCLVIGSMNVCNYKAAININALLQTDQ